MDLKIQSFFIKADATYFGAKEKLYEIVSTPNFTEHHMRDRSIFLRHDRRIKDGDVIAIFVEPQINITASLRNSAFVVKLQLTAMKYTAHPGHPNGIEILPFAKQMTVPDFIYGLNPCDGWKEWLEKLCPVLPSELFNS